jgi:hypothetical protein
MKKVLILSITASLVGVGFWFINQKQIDNNQSFRAETEFEVSTNAIEKTAALPATETGAPTASLKNQKVQTTDLAQAQIAEPFVKTSFGYTQAQRFEEAQKIEFEKTKDPALGYVPEERRLIAAEQTMRMQAQMQKDADILRGSISSLRWVERGPFNVGGRSRAILVDESDKTGNTVWVAGSTGGLYKTTNVKGLAKWTPVNGWLDNLTVSSITQDPRNPKVMYIGTGDSDGSGGFVPGTGGTRGVGVYKSIDGGETWRLLPSSSTLLYIPDLLVTPDSGHVFAAAFSGLYKSKDGGTTWTLVQSGKARTIKWARDKRLYTSMDGGNVYRSSGNGERGTWQSLRNNPGFPIAANRVELAVAPSNPNYIYVVCEIAGTGTPVYRSTNGGDTWTVGAMPAWGCSANPVPSDFTSGQAWYDLCITVDPTNETTVWIGGIEQLRSSDGGNTWAQMTGGYCNRFPYAHVDQHIQYFDPLDPSVLYLGNDGGIFRVSNAQASRPAIRELNNGYITTQFYGCAIHPDSAVNYFLGGTQDNSSIAVAGSKGAANGRVVLGGDGFYCFIDQDNPNIQLATSQGGNWGLSTNGGVSFGGGVNSNSAFYVVADYDDKADILYAQTGGGDIWRWKVSAIPAERGVVDVVGASFTSGVSQIYCDQNVDNRIYVGLRNGNLYRVDDANAATIDKVALVGRFNGYVSSIDVERGNPNHIIVCLSNYGILNIRESLDGGATWRDCDGNLPDMPVRWALFNPNDPTQAIIATDLGVWSTDKLDGSATTWIPPTPNRGTPLVRTDMLQIRKSDNMVLAATYGRGLWTTSGFGKAKASMEYPQVGYLDVPIEFKGESSAAANSFQWRFAPDNTTDTLENTKKTFKQIGSYDVSLTINGDNNLKTAGKIKILPSLPTPYRSTTTDYGGNFDGGSWDAHFGAWSVSGSKFERGKSGVFGKDGTKSGAFAYVLALGQQNYQINTEAYLNTPNFDLTKQGIYQFSFWANYDIQLGRDGLQVQYSLDKGLTWKTLGSKNDPDWYTYLNNSVTDGAFNLGESYITGTADNWTRFKLNISDLAGNANVAFRFVFKSATFAPSAGVALDDIQITRFEGENKTAVITQSGAYSPAGNTIDINFQTQPEYYSRYFDIEISENGRTWRKVESSVPSSGFSTEELQNYTVNVKGTPKDLYYFRIRSLNENKPTNYNYEFTTAPFVVKRNKDLPLGINTAVQANLFVNKINVVFTGNVDATTVFDLFDVAGRLISSQAMKVNGVYHELNVPNLPKAMYILRVQIGDGKAESFKLFGGN